MRTRNFSAFNLCLFQKTPKAHKLPNLFTSLIFKEICFFSGCDLDVLLFVGAKSCEVERSVNVHPHLRKTFCNARMSKLEAESSIDWACAEALAIGSLLYQGSFDKRRLTIG